jgi:hypothetical protein
MRTLPSWRQTSVWAFLLMTLALAAVRPTPARAAGPFQYHALTPCRVFDTRTVGYETNGNALLNPGPYAFRVQGQCGVPNGAAAVSANFTVVSPSANGDLRAYPANGPAPAVSVLNYPQGSSAIANGALVPLAAVAAAGDKDVQFAIGMTVPVGTGSIHLIMDITGYFQ